MKIAVVKQKGGTGASALATTLAVSLLNDNVTCLIDLDPNQQTSANHLAERHRRHLETQKPSNAFHVCAKVINDGKKAVRASNKFPHTVFDGAATASISTGIIAQNSDLVLIPTGFGKDDLDPNINLAYELIDSGVEQQRLFFVFCNAQGTKTEESAAFDYLESAELKTLKTVIRNKACYRQALNIGKILTEVSFVGPRVAAKTLIKEILSQ